MTAFKRGDWYLLDRPDRDDEWIIKLITDIPKLHTATNKMSVEVYGLPIKDIGIVGRVTGWVDVADLTTPITKEVARIMWSSNHVNDE